MFSDVVLIHRAGSLAASTLSQDLRPVSWASEVGDSAAETGWFLWQTCLRQIALGDEFQYEFSRSRLLPSDRVYRGEFAYQFLLEVICGLHSPLVGETEVYGQFKNTVAQFPFPLTPWGSQLKRFFKALFEDAKQIRQNHLVELGSQSYGSVVRRELRKFNGGLTRIEVLGAGQLVKEILPWIAKDEAQIKVFARDPEKAQKQLGCHRSTTLAAFQSFRDLSEAQVLIIAAPLDAEAISQWAQKMPQLKTVIDLRADSATNVLNVAADVVVINLNEVFARIASNQALITERKSLALGAITVAIAKRNQHVEYRPFGWEDVCA